ncbi:hypothetical protein E2C01_094735 [Portunus trituberculatus]|uniref:Uncharacterized protein n=1 Tax=Portunus trituberculatus TaxID=210409 RepID=A0A5B7K2H0_PORTR|nr:hypothetical protein [Portunus trituberculatus]
MFRLSLSPALPPQRAQPPAAFYAAPQLVPQTTTPLETPRLVLKAPVHLAIMKNIYGLGIYSCCAPVTRLVVRHTHTSYRRHTCSKFGACIDIHVLRH